MSRILNDAVLERGGGYFYDKKENVFLVSKKTLQSGEASLQNRQRAVKRKQELIRESTLSIQRS